MRVWVFPRVALMLSLLVMAFPAALPSYPNPPSSPLRSLKSPLQVSPSPRQSYLLPTGFHGSSPFPCVFHTSIAPFSFLGNCRWISASFELESGPEVRAGFVKVEALPEPEARVGLGEGVLVVRFCWGLEVRREWCVG